MPVYDYKCEECGHVFEATHAINEKISECEKCSKAVRKVFHPVGIVFKGQGFYKTDSRGSEGSSERTQKGTGVAQRDDALPEKTEGAADAKQEPAADADKKKESVAQNDK